jgi:hypothetical protein
VTWLSLQRRLIQLMPQSIILSFQRNQMEAQVLDDRQMITMLKLKRPTTLFKSIRLGYAFYCGLK